MFLQASITQESYYGAECPIHCLQGMTSISELGKAAPMIMGTGFCHHCFILMYTMAHLIPFLPQERCCFRCNKGTGFLHREDSHGGLHVCLPSRMHGEQLLVQASDKSPSEVQDKGSPSRHGHEALHRQRLLRGWCSRPCF